MFSRKYIFETKTTRLKRWTGNIFLCSLGGSLVFFLLCIYLPFHAKKLNEVSNAAFFQKAPDLIVVFTGDKGRITYAVNKVKESEETHLLISGVHAANALKNIVTPQELADLTEKQVEIDYFARNTHENVLYTLRFLEKKSGAKKVLVISSDYHLLRIQFLLSQLASENSPFEFFLQGTPTQYTNTRNIKILIKETIKLIRSLFFIVFWEYENEAT